MKHRGNLPRKRLEHVHLFLRVGSFTVCDRNLPDKFVVVQNGNGKCTRQRHVSFGQMKILIGIQWTFFQQRAPPQALPVGAGKPNVFFRHFAFFPHSSRETWRDEIPVIIDIPEKTEFTSEFLEYDFEDGCIYRFIRPSEKGGSDARLQNNLVTGFQ